MSVGPYQKGRRRPLEEPARTCACSTAFTANLQCRPIVNVLHSTTLWQYVLFLNLQRGRAGGEKSVSVLAAGKAKSECSSHLNEILCFIWVECSCHG